jgi:uncharacterized membrane protein YidH (DUF202 family)
MNNEDIKKELATSKFREAAEQTFLGWAQLGLILVSLGFASVGVISYIQAQSYKAVVAIFVSLVGDLFVIAGFTSIVAALLQYKAKMKNIGKMYALDLPLFIGVMICALGVIAFLAIAIDVLL